MSAAICYAFGSLLFRFHGGYGGFSLDFPSFNPVLQIEIFLASAPLVGCA